MAEIMLWTAERIELTCGYNEGFYTNRTDIVSSTIKDLVLLYRGNTSETRLLLGSPHIHLYWLNIESFQGNSTNGKWKVKVPGAGAFFSVGEWGSEVWKTVFSWNCSVVYKCVNHEWRWSPLWPLNLSPVLWFQPLKAYLKEVIWFQVSKLRRVVFSHWLVWTEHSYILNMHPVDIKLILNCQVNSSDQWDICVWEEFTVRKWASFVFASTKDGYITCSRCKNVSDMKNFLLCYM